MGTWIAPAFPPQSDVPWAIPSFEHAFRAFVGPGSRRSLAVPSTVLVVGRPPTPERARASSCSPSCCEQDLGELGDYGPLAPRAWVPASLPTCCPDREAAILPAARSCSQRGAARGADASRGLQPGDPRGQDDGLGAHPRRRRVRGIRRYGALVDWRVGGTARGPDCFHEGPRTLRPPGVPRRLQRRGLGRASSSSRRCSCRCGS